jgi:hypothetical protein
MRDRGKKSPSAQMDGNSLIYKGSFITIDLMGRRKAKSLNAI